MKENKEEKPTFTRKEKEGKEEEKTRESLWEEEFRVP